MDVSAPRRKPLITANQVTLARLALLPLGCWLLYQGVRGQWVALIFMTFVGCTDFVDGWMARRQGPTVLGGLMDPIADKVFIAAVLLPTIELGWLPLLIVMLIFVRETVITAARTAYERRRVPLASSYLAKIKTWYQMIVSALIFLLRMSPAAPRWVLAVGTIGAALGGVIFYLVRRRPWRGSVAFTISFGAFFTVAILSSDQVLAAVLGWSTVAITWASGGAYLVGMRDLAGKGRIDANDLVRLLGALFLPVLACLLMATARVPSWAVISTLALEFAIGGLDNLLAHQGRLPSLGPFTLRVALQTGLLCGALALVHRGGAQETINGLCIAAFAVTLLAAAVFFARNRQAYRGVAADEPIAAQRTGG